MSLNAIQRLRRHVARVPFLPFKRRTVDEWVTVAEQLARQHGDILPNTWWLITNGHRGMYDAMQRYPEKFRRFKQKKYIKSPDEHVATAEQLAREHGGTLPNSEWLKKNEYGGLCNAKRCHPEKFRHIPQDKKFKTLEDHLATAKRLTHQHSGILPNSRWLQLNGFEGFRQAMRKYPEKFRRFKQKKCIKSLDEHVAIAKRLAREHGGVLPNRRWLKENGHGGLDNAVQKYPRAFSQFKQMRLNTQGRRVA